MKKKFLEIGKIVTTHGVMGEVKVYPLVRYAGFSHRLFHSLFS